MTPSRLSEDTKAYIAGIIDGEGTILITERARREERNIRNSSFVLSVVVSMTDPEAVELMRLNFKGNYGKFHRYGKKDYYRFSASTRDARELLEAIRPYIRVKSKRVELAIQYLDMPVFTGSRIKGVPECITIARRAFAQEMKRLNQGGE